MKEEIRFRKITKEELLGINAEKVRVYSWAGGGACGMPGEVRMILSNGDFIEFNWIEFDVDARDLFKESTAKEVLYTGLGNCLYIDPTDKNWLMEKLSQYEKHPYYPMVPLYQRWAEFYKERIGEET